MKYIKWAFWLLALACVALAGYNLNSCRQYLAKKPVDMELGFEKDIKQTPAVLQSIERLGQWEFLSIDDEVMVDTTDSHLLSPDDHLVRIYHGTLRLGIDFSLCDRGWAMANGDTVSLQLPPIQLLDRNFIDEARTKSFYESGKWKGADLESLYRKAHRMMLAHGLTPENLRQAEDNADSQFRRMMKAMGFQTVIIRFNNQ